MCDLSTHTVQGGCHVLLETSQSSELLFYKLSHESILQWTPRNHTDILDHEIETSACSSGSLDLENQLSSAA